MCFFAWFSGFQLRPAGFGPVDVEELAAGLVRAFVGVGAEEVALPLEQVGGQALAAVAVVVGQGAEERRSGDAVLGGFGDDEAESSDLSHFLSILSPVFVLTPQTASSNT